MRRPLIRVQEDWGRPNITTDALRCAFYDLKRTASAGVDGLVWKEYEGGLDERLLDLHGRVHSGAYRALPSRRVEIPKPDGGTRPLGIAALEDKIVQKAVVDVILTPIYEPAFLGFSYGVRPGRGAHDALDALAFGIERRKVSVKSLFVRTLSRVHGGGTGTRTTKGSGSCRVFVGVRLRTAEVMAWLCGSRRPAAGRVGLGRAGSLARYKRRPGPAVDRQCRRSPWNGGMLFHSSEFMSDWRNESDNEGCHSTAPDRTGRFAGPCRQSRCGHCRAWWKAGRREVVDTASEAAAEAAQDVGGSAEGHVRADEEVLGGASEAICCDRERRVCRRGEWGERRVVGASGSRRHHCYRDAGGDAEDVALQACAQPLSCRMELLRDLPSNEACRRV